MGKLNLAKICQSIKTSFGKHSPEILTGLGIAGSVVAIVCAVKATPKAMVLIEEKKKELQKDFYQELNQQVLLWVQAL